jgi:hypothetical protein
VAEDSSLASLGALAIRETDLLVFLDETGHEDFAGTERLFGVGGVIACAPDYFSQVERPWFNIRQSIGLAPTQPLHAATDLELYRANLPSIAEFFQKGVFVRHTSIVTAATDSTMNAFVTATCAGLARNVGRVLARVCSTGDVERVVYIVEHSTRLHDQYQSLYGQVGPTLIRTDGTRRAFPHIWCAMRKSSCNPGLEVSDFILHAAQGHVRSRKRDPHAPYRKDFQVVFRDVSRDLVEYMEITTAVATESDGVPGTFTIGLA